MTKQGTGTDLSGKTGEAETAARSEAAAAPDDSCRCEEVSKMTPRQLLGLMLRDLAFWKKPKQG